MRFDGDTDPPTEPPTEPSTEPSIEPSIEPSADVAAETRGGGAGRGRTLPSRCIRCRLRMRCAMHEAATEGDEAMAAAAAVEAEVAAAVDAVAAMMTDVGDGMEMVDEYKSTYVSPRSRAVKHWCQRVLATAYARWSEYLQAHACTHIFALTHAHAHTQVQCVYTGGCKTEAPARRGPGSPRA